MTNRSKPVRNDLSDEIRRMFNGYSNRSVFTEFQQSQPKTIRKLWQSPSPRSNDNASRNKKKAA